MKWVVLSFFAFVVFSCSDDEVSVPQGPQPNSELMRQLEGEWVNILTRIEMRSYRNGDSVKTLSLNEAQWQAQMGQRPVRTFFKSGTRYHQIMATVKDSFLTCPAGIWVVAGDTLYMRDTFPQFGQVYQYKIKLSGDSCEWSSMEDCDGDGKKDDVYYCIQRRKRGD